MLDLNFSLIMQPRFFIPVEDEFDPDIRSQARHQSPRTPSRRKALVFLMQNYNSIQ
jgi:hypothetical protein